MRSKLPDTGTTIFSVMSRMARENDAINLSQGFPNYSSAPLLFDLVKKHMDEGRNQYAPLAGVLPLRQAVVNKAAQLYSRQLDPETEVCITAGATQAVYTAIQTLIHPGDEVIIFEPAFDIYAPAIQLNGGKVVRMQLMTVDFSINWSDVRKAVNSKTKAIIINSPHNPTGAVLSQEDMAELQSIVLKNDLYVISDEVYEHLIFDGVAHESVLKYDPLFERSIVCFSFGKTFHNTGWKVGHALAPKHIMAEFHKIHQFIVFSVNTPVQFALADYMQDANTYLSLNSFYEKKRDHFIQLLKDSRFKIRPAAGSYFQLLDYSNISDISDIDFTMELVQKHKVAAIPISPFYHHPKGDKLVRFCFAKTNDILEQAAERLCKI